MLFNILGSITIKNNIFEDEGNMRENSNLIRNVNGHVSKHVVLLLLDSCYKSMCIVLLIIRVD